MAKECVAEQLEACKPKPRGHHSNVVGTVQFQGSFTAFMLSAMIMASQEGTWKELMKVGRKFKT